MTDSVFDLYSSYYDLLYRDKDYVSEADYVAGLLDRFGVKGQKLLEFGSGTGKHGCLLAERGYRVTGIERSAEMVAEAEATPGFTCQQGNICDLHLGHTYDAVLSLFHVVSYQITNQEVEAVFACAAEHLELGGLFLFDVWYTPAVHSQKPETRVKRIEDGSREITRLAEPVSHLNANSVDVNYTIFARDTETDVVGIFSETHSMRHFSVPELELFAKMSGFEIVGVEEFLTGSMPSEKTWGVCFILRRVL